MKLVMYRVVLDTNVLISGLISPKGSPAKIIDLWLKKKFILITSKEILKEAERVLLYPRIAQKYGLGKKKIEEYVRGFFVFSEVVLPAKKIFALEKDPDDNKFIEAALNSNARFIVSGDKHLLVLKKYKGIEMLTPIEFCSQIKEK